MRAWHESLPDRCLESLRRRTVLVMLWVMKRTGLILKRFFDTVGAALLLLLLSPLLLPVALLIRGGSRGPALFKQPRLGYRGKVFLIYKFRTMVDGAEKLGSGVFTSRDDPRITRVGHLLRRTSLDELPQLLNIVRGEMSFVGPRPPVPYHPYRYDAYSAEQRLRFSVRPGITGYAQVTGRNQLEWDERIHYDVIYVKNWSLGLDLKILVRTLSVVSKRRGVFSDRLDAAQEPGQ